MPATSLIRLIQLPLAVSQTKGCCRMSRLKQRFLHMPTRRLWNAIKAVNERPSGSKTMKHISKTEQRILLKRAHVQSWKFCKYQQEDLCGDGLLVAGVGI